MINNKYNNYDHHHCNNNESINSNNNNNIFLLTNIKSLQCNTHLIVRYIGYLYSMFFKSIKTLIIMKQ